MQEDCLRTERVRQEISSAGLDAAICRLSSHVLMLTGYAPVLAESFVLFPRQGNPTLIVPDAEENIARAGWCLDIRPYSLGGLRPTTSVLEAVRPILARVIAEHQLDTATFGYEGTSAMEPVSYSQIGFPSAGTYDMIRQAAPRAQFVDFAPVLRVLEATKTPREVDRLRAVANVARLGFEAARDVVGPGMSEATVASAAEAAIQAVGRKKGFERVQGFAHVMSGSRSALAYQAFNLTNDRQIQAGDPVLVQLEVYGDGYWSEATRTFFAGEPGAEGRRIYECCLEAQEKALATIHNGAAASDVDQAARDDLSKAGFGQCFRHGLGHGLGFQATSHLQPPRLSPSSTDTILTDMVFNVEPGVYVHGWGGVRVNDTVVARESDAEIITQIPRDLQWAIVPSGARTRA